MKPVVVVVTMGAKGGTNHRSHLSLPLQPRSGSEVAITGISMPELSSLQVNILFLLAIALIPGAVSWWLGRRLLRSLDSPALAEGWWLVRRRQIQVASVCLVILVFFAGVDAVWLVSLLVVVALAGAFPARRAILEEQWNLGQYLLWLARLLIALASFWMLVIAAPALVAWAGPERAWVAAVVALALAIRLFLPQRYLLTLLGATPMDGDEVEGMPRFLAHLGEVSTAPQPGLFRLELNGGRWVNALAVPHPARPAVVFSQPLLDLLTPDEVEAVLAHEVAHLEHFNPRRLRWQGVGAAVLAAAAVLLVPANRLIFGESSWVPLVWLVLLLVIFGHWMARHRENEAASDQRALELCGNPEALISALRTLHEANRVPRRLSRKDEDRSTHPSLARRIQAIRSAGLVEAKPAVESLGAEALGSETVIATTRAGEWIILDGDRITWLGGVPDPAGSDPDLMRKTASTTRSTAYSGFTELRIRVPLARCAELVAVTTAGERSVTPLSQDLVSVVQQALDAADQKIARPPAQTVVSRTAGATRWVRFLAALSGLIALTLPGSGAVVVSSLLALLRPRATWLLAAGAGCLSGAALSANRLSDVAELARIQRSGVVVVILAALVFFIVGAARSRLFLGDREKNDWLPAFVLGVALAVVWTAVLVFAWFNGDGAVDLFWLHRGVRWAPSLIAFPIGIAAALAIVKNHRLRWAAPGAVALAALALWFGSGAFQRAYVRDPMLPTSPMPEVATAELERILELDLEADAHLVRLSPDGSHVAIGRSGYEIGGYDLVGFTIEWTVRRIDDREAPEIATIKARGIALLDDGHALVLVDESGEGQATPSRLRLSRLDLKGGGEVVWSIVMSAIAHPDLGVNPDADHWRVTGQIYRPDEVWEWIAAEGPISSGEIVEHRYAFGEHFVNNLVILGGDTALAVANRFDDRFGASPLLLLGLRSRFELLLVEGEAQSSLARTRLELECVELDLGEAMCAARDSDSTYLWRVSREEEGRARYKPIAMVPTGDFYTIEAFDGGGLLRSLQNDDVVVFDRRSSIPYRFSVASEGWQTAVAASSSGVIAEVLSHEDGSRLIISRVGP